MMLSSGEDRCCHRKRFDAKRLRQWIDGACNLPNSSAGSARLFSSRQRGQLRASWLRGWVDGLWSTRTARTRGGPLRRSAPVLKVRCLRPAIEVAGDAEPTGPARDLISPQSGLDFVARCRGDECASSEALPTDWVGSQKYVRTIGTYVRSRRVPESKFHSSLSENDIPRRGSIDVLSLQTTERSSAQL